MPEIITNASNSSFTPEDKQTILEATQWLKDWLQKRGEQKDIEGHYFMPLNELRKVNEQFAKLRIYDGRTAGQDMERDIQAGTIRMKNPLNKQQGANPEELTRQPGFGEYMQRKFNTEHNPMKAGQTLTHSVDPVMVLHPDNILETRGQGYTESLGSATVHEMTHGMNLRHEEYVMRQMLEVMQGPESTVYTPRELYARLNQLRYNFELDPTRVYTMEDVAKMRQEMERNLEDYSAKFLDAVDKNGGQPLYPEQLPEMPRKMDAGLFEVFSDFQISCFLNAVTEKIDQGRDLDQMDRDRSFDRSFTEQNMASENRDMLQRNRQTEKLDTDLGRSRDVHVRLS